MAELGLPISDRDDDCLWSVYVVAAAVGAPTQSEFISLGVGGIYYIHAAPFMSAAQNWLMELPTSSADSYSDSDWATTWRVRRVVAAIVGHQPPFLAKS